MQTSRLCACRYVKHLALVGTLDAIEKKVNKVIMYSQETSVESKQNGQEPGRTVATKHTVALQGRLHSDTARTRRSADTTIVSA